MDLLLGMASGGDQSTQPVDEPRHRAHPVLAMLGGPLLPHSQMIAQKRQVVPKSTPDNELWLIEGGEGDVHGELSCTGAALPSPSGIVYAKQWKRQRYETLPKVEVEIRR